MPPLITRAVEDREDPRLHWPQCAESAPGVDQVGDAQLEQVRLLGPRFVVLDAATAEGSGEHTRLRTAWNAI